MSQSIISREVIKSLMDQGKSREEIISEGSKILYERFQSGDFEIRSEKVTNPESYCKSLIINYLRPGKGIVEGEENHRGPRSPKKESSPDLRSILKFMRESGSTDESLVTKLEEEISFQEYRKVG
jgi:hypothetical protein